MTSTKRPKYKKASYKVISEKEFQNFKLLQSAGLTDKLLAQVSGRSPSTVSFMKLADTLVDYHRLISEKSARQKAKLRAEKEKIADYEPLVFERDEVITLENEDDKSLEEFFNPTQPAIKQMVVGRVNGFSDKVLGLSEDNKVYLYSNGGWTEF